MPTVTTFPLHRPTTGDRRILVADDDPDIRETLALLLAVEGYSVTAVADGRGAVAAARACCFRIALLDVAMPHLDGVSAARELRRIDPDLAIVFHTSMEEDVVRKGLRTYDGFFRKPASMDELLRRMLQLDRPGGPLRSSADT